jgi:hypothetical protein
VRTSLQPLTLQLTLSQAALAWEDPRSNRGYVAKGRERVTQSADPTEIAQLREKAPDYKESMEIGRDWDSEWKNQWPREQDAPSFKRTMLDFFQVISRSHIVVLFTRISLAHGRLAMNCMWKSCVLSHLVLIWERSSLTTKSVTNGTTFDCFHIHP